MARSQDIIDSVADSNLKTIAESGAFYTASLHQIHVNAIAELGAITRAATAKAIKALLENDAEEAASTQKILSGNDLAQQLAQLTAAVASIQQSVKAAQTTPPQTGG